MRLFVGIDIPDDIRRGISGYVDRARAIAPAAKWVNPDSYHVTLKFIGEFPEQRLDELKSALANVHAPGFDIAFRDVGFFTPRRPLVFWLGVHADDRLSKLAAAVDDATSQLGIRREDREYSPHLTLARTGSGRPQGSPRDRNKPPMWQLRDAAPSLPKPDFGTMTAQAFFLYESKLSPKGAQYTKIARFGLGG